MASNTRKLIILALCITINILGSFLALALRLPIYLDTIGTIFGALCYGPLAGLAIGSITALISGISFDITSLYYLPVQAILGLITGFLYKHFKKYFSIRSIIYIALITIIGSVVSSIITSLLFSGITSSGSSYIVAVLNNLGVNLFISVFSTQILTDLIDKYIAFFISFMVIKYLPKNYFKEK